MRRVAHPQPLRFDAGGPQARYRGFDRRYRSRDNDMFRTIPRGNFQNAFAPRNFGRDYFMARKHGRHRAIGREFLGQAATFGDELNRILKI